MAEDEARISIYRNGRRIDISDARGDSPTAALYMANNDLELAMQRYELKRPREFRADIEWDASDVEVGSHDADR